MASTDKSPPGDQDEGFQDQYWDTFKEFVDRGRAGKAVWMPIAHPTLSQHTGISKSRYVLLGGDPGTGKSAFTHLNYVLHPYEWWRQNREETDIELKIILRSMERSKHFIIGKWVCWRLWKKYGIKMDVKTMYGWGSQKSKVTDEIYEKVKETRDYFYEMQEVVTIIDGGENPTGVRNTMIEHAENHGKSWKPNKYEKRYEPHNDHLINIHIIDHIGRITGERNYSQKQLIDKMSEYLGNMRDLYGYMNVVVNQFNRNLSDSTRRTRMQAAPEKQDFKGSSNMYEDCDVALALFNPYKYNVQQFQGYEMEDFVNDDGYNRFRTVHLLKNHFGVDDLTLGLNFIGEIGHFRELKSPDRLNADLMQMYVQGLTPAQLKKRIAA